MTSLREAAQRLAHAVKRYDRDGGTQPFRELVDDADALLALPPDPGGWAEGARALRSFVETVSGPAFSREDLREEARCLLMPGRFPVPPATTAHEAKGAWGDSFVPSKEAARKFTEGSTAMLTGERAAWLTRQASVPATAPEAKPAESEVGE